MRLLTEDELNLVAGGNFSSENDLGTATVHGHGLSWGDFMSYWYGYMGSPGEGSNSNPPPDNPFDDPDCDKANAIVGITPQDNAKYFLPENVSEQYLKDVLNHLSLFSQTHTAAELLFEFKDMYQNPSNPWFIDFKDWGTAGGPAGSVSGGTTTYYSPAAGHEVTSSVFEPFGNWFYGFAGTWAGISSDVLFAAAALLQEGSGMSLQDAPEDQPHVIAGINAATAWQDNPTRLIGIAVGNCSSGTTEAFIAAAELAPFIAQPAAAQRTALWGGLHDWYAQVNP